MSSRKVSGYPLPEEIEWRPIDPPIPEQINKLGERAVEKQNDVVVLTFIAVEAAWTIPLASNYGKLYALIIKATPSSGVPGQYLAIVRANLPANFEQLLSFAEYSAAQ